MTEPLVHRTKQMVHPLSGASLCTAHQLVGRPVQTDESSVWVGPSVVAARRATEAGAPSGEFTYAVIREPVAAGGERRAVVRRRTRLRSGKVVGADGRFVVECLIANRSAQGGLMRLPSPIPLPPRILVYDDQSGDLLVATVVWRRGRDVGLRFGEPERDARFHAIADSMRRKFYAVR